MNTLDRCPVCKRQITDFAEDGCESPVTSQRYCISHLPLWEMWNFIADWYQWEQGPMVRRANR